MSESSVSLDLLSVVFCSLCRYASHNLSAPIKTTLHFSLSRSGVISLDRAETVVEISELYDVPIQNTTVDSNQTTVPPEKAGQPDSVSGAENVKEGTTGDDQKEPSHDSAADKPLTTKKLRKRTIRIPLKVSFFL